MPLTVLCSLTSNHPCPVGAFRIIWTGYSKILTHWFADSRLSSKGDPHLCSFLTRADFELVSLQLRRSVLYILRGCLLQRNGLKNIGSKKINPHMIKGFFSSLSVSVIILKGRIKGNFNFPDTPWWLSK